MIRSWLRIEPAQSSQITIDERLDFVGNAIKNSIWYRGKSEELTQLYRQIPSDNTTFWRASSTAGMEIRKIHTGLPKLIVDVLTSVVMADMQDIDISSEEYADIWENIEKENNFKQLVIDALKKTLYIGDGAFKISIDTSLTDYPIIEFISGDRVEYVYKRGRICEVIFNTVYVHNHKEYLLKDYYGRGYVNYKLFYNDKEVALNSIPQTETLKNITYNAVWLMAVPLKIYTSDYYEGRGQSIFDGGRTESFDALDEAWSQWMYAVRRSRPKEYLPPNMIPKDPNTGKNLTPNAFDNVYISTEGGMPEDGKSEIKLIQPVVPHESYLSTYITALDLCLQGLISPSTLGIDTKKLDNAEAQREKEKTTLYTRNHIISVLQQVLPILIDTAIKVYKTTNEQSTEDIEVDVTFGEYANPSFESQVETVGKGRTQGIMSVEACVDELYGDTKDDEWKSAEIARIKAEMGVVTGDEPAVNTDMS